MKKITIPKDFDCTNYKGCSRCPMFDIPACCQAQGNPQSLRKKTILILDEGDKLYTESEVEDLKEKAWKYEELCK